MVNLMFSEKEIEYLKSQHIARIATAAVRQMGLAARCCTCGFRFRR